MPFIKVEVDKIINQKKQESGQFQEAWEESREEYRLIGELIRIRKEEKITQTKLAEITGNKQQVISRIENKESVPTLRTFCNLINALGYTLQIVKKV